VRARGREVYIIAAVVAIVLIVAWYFLLFSPTRSQIADLNDQIDTANAAVASSKQQLAQLESYKKTAPQSRAEVVRLGKMLPEAEGVPSVIVELSRTADVSGVDLVSITRGEAKTGAPFGIQTLTLQLSGRFFDIEDFLYRLEQYVVFRNAGFRVTGRLLEVNAVSITGGASSTTTSTTVAPLTVSVTLQGYLWGGSSATSSAGGTP